MSDKNYTDVLLEDMNSKFDRLIEVMSQMREEMSTFAKSEELNEIKTDVKTIKAAVTDVSKNVERHDLKLQNLKIA